MASIKNPDQVGKSVRSREAMDAIRVETYNRVIVKTRKMSTARLYDLLPRCRADARNHKARVSRLDGMRRAVVETMIERGIVIQEWMFGQKFLNRDYRGEYKEVPRL